MRQNTSRRTIENQDAVGVVSSRSYRNLSRLSATQKRAKPSAARRPRGKDALDMNLEDDVFHHLSSSLASFEVIIVPGLDGSAPHHWQSRWEEALRSQGIAVSRVRQKSWSRPNYKNWLIELVMAVNRSKKPVLLVAHSLGCILIAHAAKDGLLPNTVAGALLVAPADVENGPEQDLSRVADFASVPLSVLPFSTLVVSSRNDPWLSITQARFFARQWGGAFIDAGHKGHIGNQSDLAYWLDGLLFLDRLAHSVSHG